jgi:hypothetical protein
MASGQTLLVLSALGSCGPAGTTTAQFDIVNGASTPAESFPVLAFDGATQEYADWHLLLPRAYSGGGLTVTLVTSTSVTTGGAVWEAALRRVQDDAEDLDTTAQTYDFNSVTVVSPPSAAGEVTYDNITFTNGADMDSVAAGEMFILRLRRAPANASDTITVDVFLHRIEIRET